jgi:hypothetical protein
MRTCSNFKSKLQSMFVKPSAATPQDRMNWYRLWLMRSRAITLGTSSENNKGPRKILGVSTARRDALGTKALMPASERVPLRACLPSLCPP